LRSGPADFLDGPLALSSNVSALVASGLCFSIAHCLSFIASAAISGTGNKELPFFTVICRYAISGMLTLPGYGRGF